MKMEGVEEIDLVYLSFSNYFVVYCVCCIEYLTKNVLKHII